MKQKLLLIAPIFFDYYKEIMREAKLLGYEVDYICDMPNNSNFSKAVGRINKKILKGVTKKYFNEHVIPLIYKKKYDYVLLIGGMTFSFTPDMVEEIRKKNPDALFIMYQWDSEKNLPYSTGIHKYFDKLYTFDLDDARKMSKYIFLPLFYTRNYEEIGKENIDEFEYDCSYVGTAHPKKYKDINMIAEALIEAMPKQYIYHYMPSKLKYIYHKLFAPEYRNAKINDFKSEKVSSSEMMNIFKNSKCILDAPQAGQTGLTIRTIECLGAKRKLVTTNKDVKNYDFYNESNILVFDGNIDLTSKFFTNKYEEIDEQIYKRYSLREWLKFMLG